jgi:hypothetical protein
MLGGGAQMSIIFGGFAILIYVLSLILQLLGMLGVA